MASIAFLLSPEDSLSSAASQPLSPPSSPRRASPSESMPPLPRSNRRCRPLCTTSSLSLLSCAAAEASRIDSPLSALTPALISSEDSLSPRQHSLLDLYLMPLAAAAAAALAADSPAQQPHSPHHPQLVHSQATASALKWDDHLPDDDCLSLCANRSGAAAAAPITLSHHALLCAPAPAPAPALDSIFPRSALSDPSLPSMPAFKSPSLSDDDSDHSSRSAPTAESTNTTLAHTTTTLVGDSHPCVNLHMTPCRISTASPCFDASCPRFQAHTLPLATPRTRHNSQTSASIDSSSEQNGTCIDFTHRLASTSTSISGSGSGSGSGSTVDGMATDTDTDTDEDLKATAIHLPNGKYGCPECDKSYHRQCDFRSHYRVHQSRRPFQCRICTQSFLRRHDLNRHSRIHLGLKPYCCHRCAKGFVRKDALRRHLHMDPLVQRFRCVYRPGPHNDAINKL